MKELLKKLHEAREQMRSLVEKAKTENRDLTAEERSSFENIEVEIRCLNAEIQSESAKIQAEIRSQENASDKMKLRFAEMATDAVKGTGPRDIKLRAINTESVVHQALVPVVPKEMIDVIEKGFVLSSLGAESIFGVHGLPMWPVASSFEASVVGEIDEVQESTLSFSKIESSPKRISAAVAVSNLAIIQSNIHLYDYILKELGLSVVRKLNHVVCDTVAHGALSGPFVGLTDKKITHTKAGVYTRKNILDIEHKVLDDMMDAMSDNASFIVNTKMMGILEDTLENTNSTRYLLRRFSENGKRKGEMIGLNVAFSNFAGDNKILFGDFQHLKIPFYGETRITVDPYTLAKKDSTLFVINMFVDMVKTREAFAYSTTA